MTVLARAQLSLTGLLPDTDRTMSDEQVLGLRAGEWVQVRSREEILARLSRELPEAVDKYTPQGRLPVAA